MPLRLVCVDAEPRTPGNNAASCTLKFARDCARAATALTTDVFARNASSISATRSGSLNRVHQLANGVAVKAGDAAAPGLSIDEETDHDCGSVSTEFVGTAGLIVAQPISVNATPVESNVASRRAQAECAQLRAAKKPRFSLILIFTSNVEATDAVHPRLNVVLIRLSDIGALPVALHQAQEP